MDDDLLDCVNAHACKEALRLLPCNRDVIAYLLQQNGVKKLKSVRNRDKKVGSTVSVRMYAGKDLPEKLSCVTIVLQFYFSIVGGSFVLKTESP